MDTIKIEQTKKIVIDSVEYIRSSDVSAFYADLADKQATQFTILISIICGIVVFIIGATWWWNYRGAKQQISEEISMNKETLMRLFRQQAKKVNDILRNYEQKYKNDKIELQKSINNQIDQKSRHTQHELKEVIESFEKVQKDEIERNQKEVEKKIKEEQAELSRIFALHCTSTNSHYVAITWWLAAAKLYKETDNEYFLGIAIRAIEDLLNQIKTPEDNANWDDLIGMVEKVTPDIMSIEKDKIIKRMKELKNLPKTNLPTAQ
jgi:F0F1-type ATP synthase membrane subunit b/b'